jgi:two-component system, LuxR family, response regulator FixJ
VDSQSTVYVVDNDPAFLESLLVLVASMGFKARGFSVGEELLREADSLGAGCVILDMQLPDLGGLAVLEHLARKPLPPPAIVMSAYAEVAIAVRAMQLGVIAFFQKHALSETALWEAIHFALARDAENRASHARRELVQARVAQLSEPERQVLDMLVRGWDHTRIAKALEISRRTVENRRAKLMKKLGAQNFPQLIRLAMEAGILDAEQPPHLADS